MVKRRASRPKGESVPAVTGVKRKGSGKKDSPSGSRSLLPESEVFPAKQRCAGATRSGDQCRYWASADSEFCYWCQQANAPRWPLPPPQGTVAELATKHEIHKRRCAGITVYGDPCRFFAVGNSMYCSWCEPSNKPKAATKKPPAP